MSFGLSVNKMVSKVATNEGKPNGRMHILAPQVLDFLAPMPVRKIPYVGEKTSHKLSYMGVRDIATLRLIPQPVLAQAFGQQGIFLYRRARGEDDSPVIPYSEQKSISAETTFSQDTIDLRQLRATLTGLTERIAFQLRKQQKLTACIAVKLRYADFETVSRQAHIPYACTDDLLIEKVLHLFDQLYQKRLLVRLVGVRFSHLVPGNHQIDLFQDTQKQVRLYEALDAIRYRHGAKAVRRASGIT
jgi:DNA polymerase-4